MTFEYHAPASSPELLDMLAHWQSGARILAGGQTLMPLLNLRLERPQHLVDIKAVAGLDRLSCSGLVAAGAGCRQIQLEKQPGLAEAHPLLAAALPMIGDRAVRTRGTVCGSLAAAEPAAELPAVALAAGATLHVQSKSGCRDVEAGDFYRAEGGTVLRPNEFLAGVSFADWQPGCGWAIEELRYTSMSFAAAGAAIVLGADGRMARIAVFGQGIPARRMTDAESYLASEGLSTRAVDEAACRVQGELAAKDAPGIPASYAISAAAALVRRGLKRAAMRAGRPVDS